MKQKTKPTRRQRERITAAGLNWQNWLVREDNLGKLRIQHKRSGKERIL